MARFSHRPKRIARRSESERFEKSVMPAAFICLPVGVALLFGASLAFLIHGDFFREIVVLGFAIFLLPLLLTCYRFLRGHFSRQLHEP